MYSQYQGGYQQQGYGAPPPGQYGGPQQGYGAPPGAQQYGAPSPQGGYVAQQYNQYAPQPQGYNQYNAPPPPQPQQYGGHSPQPSYNGGYGAPPPSGPPAFGGPQYGGQQNFGAPPPPGMGGAMGQGGPRFLGVSIPPPPPAPPIGQLPGYDPHFDAERIRKATKGFGTDENTLINTLAPLDAFQMDLLSRTYEQTVGRSLRKTLEKELSGWVEYTLVLLSLGPLLGDLHLLHRACKGAGTHEDLLNEALLGRSNEEMFLLKEGYRRVYGKDLVHVVKGELSHKTGRMFMMALAGTRDENPFVNHQAVENDVQTLYRAGPGKIGTDEIAVCGILLSRSDQHLAAVAQAFQARHRHSLSQMVHAEFSGHMRDGLWYIARGAEMDGQGVVRDAEMLEAAMAGAGTKDERLIYRVVRGHWNRPRFQAIKNQYQAAYRQSLRRRIEGETTGKYENALMAIVEQY